MQQKSRIGELHEPGDYDLAANINQLAVASSQFGMRTADRPDQGMAISRGASGDSEATLLLALQLPRALPRENRTHMNENAAAFP
jgi:hypothetical protein